MITYTKGSIFDSSADAITIPVNTVGVMGAGLALQCQLQLPGSEALYRACLAAGMGIGRPAICTMPGGRRLVFFATKRHWKDASQLSWVDDGLATLRRSVDGWGLKSIALPRLGAGLGGLHWPYVRAAIEDHMADWDGDVFVYA